MQPQTIKEKEQFQAIKLGEMVRDLDNKSSELTWAFEIKPAAGSKKKETSLNVEIDAQMVAKISIPNKAPAKRFFPGGHGGGLCDRGQQMVSA